MKEKEKHQIEKKGCSKKIVRKKKAKLMDALLR